MAPFIALVLGTLAARLVGWLGVDYVDSWPAAIAVGLAAMFVVTGIAHFVNPLRRDMIAIVPPRLPPRPAGHRHRRARIARARSVLLLPPPGWRPRSASAVDAGDVPCERLCGADAEPAEVDDHAAAAPDGEQIVFLPPPWWLALAAASSHAYWNAASFHRS